MSGTLQMLQLFVYFYLAHLFSCSTFNLRTQFSTTVLKYFVSFIFLEFRLAIDWTFAVWYLCIDFFLMIFVCWCLYAAYSVKLSVPFYNWEMFSLSIESLRLFVFQWLCFPFSEFLGFQVSLLLFHSSVVLFHDFLFFCLAVIFLEILNNCFKVGLEIYLIFLLCLEINLLPIVDFVGCLSVLFPPVFEILVFKVCCKREILFVWCLSFFLSFSLSFCLLLHLQLPLCSSWSSSCPGHAYVSKLPHACFLKIEGYHTFTSNLSQVLAPRLSILSSTFFHPRIS